MFILKDIYIITASIIIFLLSGCFIESLILSKKNKESYLLSCYELSSALWFITYLLTLFIRNVDLITFLYGLYFSIIDVGLLLLLQFSYSLEFKDYRPSKGKFFIILYLIFIVGDSAFLLTNPITHWLFVVEPLYINGYIYSWTCKTENVFIFHSLICSVSMFAIAIRLVKNIIRTSKFYRGKYKLIIICFMFSFLLGHMYQIFPEVVGLNYALILNELLAVFIFFIVRNKLPKKIRLHLMAIASENISDAVICFDYKNRIIYENKKALAYRLRGKKEWIEMYLNTLEDYMNKTEVIEIDSVKNVFRTEFRRIRDGKGKYSGSYIRLKNCTNEVKELEREEYRATHDELTGLYNRNYFFSEMERMLKLEPDIPRYLVCTNIKNFKVVNDLFGIEFGDQILKLQAKQLYKAVRDGVIVGRISGDKFAMLIQKQYFNPELAVKNTETIKSFIREKNLQLQISIGVYEIANPYENVHTMYDKALMAIKDKKEDYTTMVSMYDTSLMKKLMEERNIISEFKYALASGQFCIFLQAQIDAATGKCIGAEALARWYDTEKGYRQPGEFIKVLENSGLIYQLDYYLWEKSVQKLSEWKKSGINLSISINISIRDFYYGNLYEYLVGLVEKYDVSPSKLNLEITESIFMGDKKLFREVITRLRDYGFIIEMDDFGSGFSSLNALKDMPMDVLKIDMAFLQKTQNEERARIIISCIVKMSKALGMTIITEGVETEVQAAFLKEIGVDIFQGYLYSKPVPVDDFEHKYLEK